MRIEDLKIFVDVVKYHSMNIAAEKNFTTPQNLSKIIKRMEDELGVVLFKRSKKGSDLTLEGEEFYFKILDILEKYHEALVSLKKTEGDDIFLPCESQTIRILCSAGAQSFAVMSTYNRMQNEHQDFVLENDEINSDAPEQIMRFLEKNDFDIIAITLSEESMNKITESLQNFSQVYMFYDEIGIVVSRINPLVNMQEVSLDKLKKYKLISFKSNIAFHDLLGEDVQYQVLTTSVDHALQLIESSDKHYTILSKCLIEMKCGDINRDNNLAIIPFENRISRMHTIFVNKNCLNNSCVKEFVRKLSENFNL